jgi:hypothetical protein
MVPLRHVSKGYEQPYSGRLPMDHPDGDTEDFRYRMPVVPQRHSRQFGYLKPWRQTKASTVGHRIARTDTKYNRTDK